MFEWRSISRPPFVSYSDISEWGNVISPRVCSVRFCRGTNFYAKPYFCANVRQVLCIVLPMSDDRSFRGSVIHPVNGLAANENDQTLKVLRQLSWRASEINKHPLFTWLTFTARQLGCRENGGNNKIANNYNRIREIWFFVNFSKRYVTKIVSSQSANYVQYTP